ncbi:hypothetical protein HOU26_gp31 [Escherichia phage IMM-002]|uniref:Uncharacterized protein n=1 Tax=Escherichia phage IMM-002 TaxID=2041760 RepID=A0A384WW62_9CAUD|nr:hypothetical protein HOU26_gp31 [Escherichia phage IMM-002]ATI16990.1 hypothetical protein [Escherichia phage IMM-002]
MLSHFLAPFFGMSIPEGRRTVASFSHSTGINLSANLKPFFSHHAPYVVGDPLYSLEREDENTNRMSSSGCCSRTSICFLRSSLSKIPLVSTMMPFGRMKSGVYLWSEAGIT